MKCLDAFSLKNEVVIVTGAGAGIERAIDRFFASAGAIHLTRNLAYDPDPKRIRVNAIAPGAIKTDALRSVLTPGIEKAMLKHTLLGRLGEPDDIANAALFPCSSAAPWISGQVLTLSGGCLQELDSVFTRIGRTWRSLRDLVVDVG